MMIPVVSVVLPVFEAEMFLAQSLHDISAQTLANTEIICVDDGSTDGSLQILEQHRARDPRIRILKQENRGAGAARNTGLAESKGQFLWFPDADDVYERNLLEKTVSSAERHNADVVVFQSDEFDAGTGIHKALDYALDERYLPHNQVSYRPVAHPEVIFQPFNGWAWDKLFRRKLLLDNNLRFQEIRTTNDLFLVLAAITKSKSLSLVRQVLAHHRSGMSHSLSFTREHSWSCCFEALSYFQEWLKANMLYGQVVKSFVNFAADLIAWNLHTLKQPQLAEFTTELKKKYVWKLDLAGCPWDLYYEKKHYEIMAQYWRKSGAFSPSLLYRQLSAILKWKLVLNRNRF